MARVRGASSTTLDSGRLTAASVRSHTGTPQVGEHLLVERDRQGVRHADARRPVRPGRRHQDRTALPQSPERGRPAPPRTGRRSARRPARGRVPGRSHPPAVYLHVPSKEALVEAVVRSRFGQRLRNAIADLPALPGVPDVPALRRLRPRLVRGAVGWTVCDVVRRGGPVGQADVRRARPRRRRIPARRTRRPARGGRALWIGLQGAATPSRPGRPRRPSSTASWRGLWGCAAGESPVKTSSKKFWAWCRSGGGLFDAWM